MEFDECCFGAATVHCSDQVTGPQISLSRFPGPHCAPPPPLPEKKSSVLTPGPVTPRPARQTTRGPQSTLTVHGPPSRSSVHPHGPWSTQSRSAVHPVTVRGPRVSDDAPGFGRLILVATAAAVPVAGVPIPRAGDGANLEVIRVGV